MMTVAYSTGGLIAFMCSLAWYEGSRTVSWIFIGLFVLGLLLLLVKEEA